MLGWHHSAKHSTSKKWHSPHLRKQPPHRLRADVGGQPRLNSFNDGCWQSQIRPRRISAKQPHPFVVFSFREPTTYAALHPISEKHVKGGLHGHSIMAQQAAREHGSTLLNVEV